MYTINSNEGNIKYHNNLKEEFVIGEAYLVDENEKDIYIFRGKADEENYNSLEDGLYISTKDNDLFVIGEPNFTTDDLIEDETDTDEEDENDFSNLLDNIKNMSNKEDKHDKNNEKELSNDVIITTKKKKSDKPKKKLDRSRRIRRDEVIHLDIDPMDDPMVRILKEKVNVSNINMEYIYSKVDISTNGYNLFYGLATRHNISWSSFEVWCKILNVEPVLTIIDKI